MRAMPTFQIFKAGKMVRKPAGLASFSVAAVWCFSLPCTASAGWQSNKRLACTADHPRDTTQVDEVVGADVKGLAALLQKHNAACSVFSGRGRTLAGWPAVLSDCLQRHSRLFR